MVNSQTESQERIRKKLIREMGSIIVSLLEDDKVVEIMLNPDGKLWVERIGEKMEHIGEMPANQAESFMATVASTLSTVMDSDNPILECELPLDGSRFEAVRPPVVKKPTFTIRKKAIKIFTLDDYVSQRIMSEQQKKVITQAVKDRKNILVVGGTGTGKTTLSNAVLHAISVLTPEHRCVIMEDTSELQPNNENIVVMKTNKDVSIIDLLKVTMRLRPDRIIVGEVRGSEALGLLKAWNTGHPGGIATVHANEALAGLTRIEQLVSEASSTPMRDLIAEAIDIVICIKKENGGRIIKEIISINGYENNQYQYENIA